MAVDDVGAVTVAAAGVDAAAATVILAASPRENMYASNQVAADMEELTMTVGERPGIDATAGDAALAADLNDAQSHVRWPVFAPAAVDGGVHAAFALPLRVGGIRLGVMDLYPAQPGALGQDQLADALLLAETACALLPDTTIVGTRHRPEEASLQHPEVHQATGMIIAQARVSAAVGLIRLPAHAYAHERRLRDVAADVFARQLRFLSDTADSDGHDDSEDR